MLQSAAPATVHTQQWLCPLHQLTVSASTAIPPLILYSLCWVMAQHCRLGLQMVGFNSVLALSHHCACTFLPVRPALVKVAQHTVLAVVLRGNVRWGNYFLGGTRGGGLSIKFYCLLSRLLSGRVGRMSRGAALERADVAVGCWVEVVYKPFVAGLFFEGLFHWISYYKIKISR